MRHPFRATGQGAMQVDDMIRQGPDLVPWFLPEES